MNEQRQHRGMESLELTTNNAGTSAPAPLTAALTSNNKIASKWKWYYPWSSLETINMWISLTCCGSWGTTATATTTTTNMRVVPTTTPLPPLLPMPRTCLDSLHHGSVKWWKWIVVESETPWTKARKTLLRKQIKKFQNFVFFPSTSPFLYLNEFTHWLKFSNSYSGGRDHQ